MERLDAKKFEFYRCMIAWMACSASLLVLLLGIAFILARQPLLFMALLIAIKIFKGYTTGQGTAESLSKKFQDAPEKLVIAHLLQSKDRFLMLA